MTNFCLFRNAWSLCYCLCTILFLWRRTKMRRAQRDIKKIFTTAKLRILNCTCIKAIVCTSDITTALAPCTSVYQWTWTVPTLMLQKVSLVTWSLSIFNYVNQSKWQINIPCPVRLRWVNWKMMMIVRTVIKCLCYDSPQALVSFITDC